MILYGFFSSDLQVYHALWISPLLWSVRGGLWLGERRALPGLSGQSLHKDPRRDL